jgi:aminoglycoside 6'-N-acetyltransferase I
MTTVRAVEWEDAGDWLALRSALWPDGAAGEHEAEIAQFFAGEFARGAWSVLLAVDDGGNVTGFVELSIRTYAEGCRGNRVAYLEGWFVLPRARGAGVGRTLVMAAERWGRVQGCAEFASDAEPDNELSRRAHRAAGFREVGLVRCFRKQL